VEWETMTAETTPEKTEKTPRIVKVAVLTPYLTRDLSDRYDDQYLQIQKEKFGYDPNNFKDTSELSTKKFRVLLETTQNHTLGSPTLADLCIIGMDERSEKEITGFKGSGLVVVRYSAFYGGTSRYTGNSPEESGYSLDLPKKVAVVKALITNDKFLDALVKRELKKIQTALTAFNKTQPEPVLITPYLAEALKVPR